MILPNIEETACAGIALTTMALFNAGARVPVFSRKFSDGGSRGFRIPDVTQGVRLSLTVTDSVSDIDSQTQSLSNLA